MRNIIQTLKTSLPVAVLSIAVLIASSGTYAESSVWKASKDDKHIYLGGTVHVLSEDDFPLPAEFDEAYAASDVLVFETDIAAMADPAFVQSMVRQLSYSDGTTIRDHLSNKSIQALELHFQQRGMSLDQFATFKPSLLFVMLSVIEMQLIGMNVEGVDAYYENKAQADSKPQLSLETPQEQILYIAGIAGDDPDALLDYALRDLANFRGLMDNLLSAWREGDPVRLDEQLVKIMQADYPDMYDNLLVKRNRDWLPDLLQYFDTKEVEFVLVGAAHLVGDIGILSMLKTQGFTIEQL